MKLTNNHLYSTNVFFSLIAILYSWLTILCYNFLSWQKTQWHMIEQHPSRTLLFFHQFVSAKIRWTLQMWLYMEGKHGSVLPGVIQNATIPDLRSTGKYTVEKRKRKDKLYCANKIYVTFDAFCNIKDK